MPNGHDKNLRRLIVCIAAYHARFGGWPTQARLAPLILFDLARVLDSDNFIRLAHRMELRTQKEGISVGGPSGVHSYFHDGTVAIGEGGLEQADRWLGVDPGPDPFWH